MFSKVFSALEEDGAFGRRAHSIAQYWVRVSHMVDILQSVMVRVVRLWKKTST